MFYVETRENLSVTVMIMSTYVGIVLAFATGACLARRFVA